MSASNGVTGTFSIDVLECTVCYTIPVSTSMVLCKNGHVFCTDCRQRLTQCGICQSPFKNRRIINVLQKILTSITVECKFKSLGCEENLSLENRESHEKHCSFRNVCKYAANGCSENISHEDLETHEESCEYRSIFCFVKSCQSDQISLPLGPMTETLFNHCFSTHECTNRPTDQRKEIDNLTEFELSSKYSNAIGTFFSHSGKVHYIFIPHFGVDEIKTSRKACLISTKIPREARKLKCLISMKHNDIEILNYVGKVFSIDDTVNIHSMYDGGLIYPTILNELMAKEEISFSFKITENV